MFAQAIHQVEQFTRPALIISRKYESTAIIPGSATLFFVNDHGDAVTCRQVAELILGTRVVSQKYEKFKQERSALLSRKEGKAALRRLEAEYGYRPTVTVQSKVNFVNCVTPLGKITCHIHMKHDLAILRFEDFQQIHYRGHAVFASPADRPEPGDMLCRLGFPYPEFTNYAYNSLTDTIDWTTGGPMLTPQFPLEGMFTRRLGRDGTIYGLELSTPGLPGQNGGPVFDKNGLVCAVQSGVRHLPLGLFQPKGAPGMIPQFYPVGQCVDAQTITEFLRSHDVEYFES